MCTPWVRTVRTMGVPLLWARVRAWQRMSVCACCAQSIAESFSFRPTERRRTRSTRCVSAGGAKAEERGKGTKGQSQKRRGRPSSASCLSLSPPPRAAQRDRAPLSSAVRHSIADLVLERKRVTDKLDAGEDLFPYACLGNLSDDHVSVGVAAREDMHDECRCRPSSPCSSARRPSQLPQRPNSSGGSPPGNAL